MLFAVFLFLCVSTSSSSSSRAYNRETWAGVRSAWVYCGDFRPRGAASVDCKKSWEMCVDFRTDHQNTSGNGSCRRRRGGKRSRRVNARLKRVGENLAALFTEGATWCISRFECASRVALFLSFVSTTAMTG